MHTHLRGRLHAVFAANRFEVNHGLTFVRVAFFARLDARLAADASRIIDEQGSFAQETLPTRTAQILYSGIFDTGSSATMVQRFTDFSSGQ